VSYLVGGVELGQMDKPDDTVMAFQQGLKAAGSYYGPVDGMLASVQATRNQWRAKLGLPVAADGEPLGPLDTQVLTTITGAVAAQPPPPVNTGPVVDKDAQVVTNTGAADDAVLRAAREAAVIRAQQAAAAAAATAAAAAPASSGIPAWAWPVGGLALYFLFFRK